MKNIGLLEISPNGDIPQSQKNFPARTQNFSKMGNFTQYGNTDWRTTLKGKLKVEKSFKENQLFFVRVEEKK